MRGSRPPRSRSTALVEAMQVEFTGERVIPGRVDADLLNEHMARYAFAARLARGKRVLDAGCGAGEIGALGGWRGYRGGGCDLRARALPAAVSRIRTGFLYRIAASGRGLRSGGGFRGDRAPARLAGLPAGSAAGAGAHRTVHRLHAQ